MRPRPLRELIEIPEFWEHFRGEDMLVYAYCALDRLWARWDGPSAVWRWLTGPPPSPVYKLSDDEDFEVMRIFTRDLDIRMGRRDRDGNFIDLA